MKKCINCQGDIEDGDHHRLAGECIRILTARIKAIIERIQGKPNPEAHQDWPGM